MSTYERAVQLGSVTERAGATLMAHMIAYFPNREISVDIARGLAAGGASYLELQFPFSDPSADGSLIQTAGTAALESGFTVRGGFELVREIVSQTGLPVFIMSYGNLVFRKGTDSFVREAKSAGASGLIVPDLPPGNDEGLYLAGRAHGVEIVPVVAPSVSDSRLTRISEENPLYLYAALRLGITGSYTEIGEENLAFLARLKRIGSRIVAGFGISSPEQVRSLAPHVHALVVGSAFVKTILDAVGREELSGLKSRLAAQADALVSGGV